MPQRAGAGASERTSAGQPESHFEGGRTRPGDNTGEPGREPVDSFRAASGQKDAGVGQTEIERPGNCGPGKVGGTGGSVAQGDGRANDG